MTLLAATPTQTWQAGEPPHDREVIIFGNLVYHDEEGGYSEPIVAPARWSDRCNDWLNQDNLTIRIHVEETLVIHHWIEMPPVITAPEVTVPAMAETLPDGSHVQMHPAGGVRDQGNAPDVKRTYFVSALGNRAGDLFAAEIKAESFADALRQALRKAEDRFAGQVYRLTSIVEQPDVSKRGPISLALEVFQGRAG